MKLAFTILGLFGLIFLFYIIRKNKKQSNKDIYPHF